MANRPGTSPEEGSASARAARLPAGVDAESVTWSFTTSRGPGGQNVNKRATRAELRIAIAALPLDEGGRERLARMASHQITDAGELVLAGQSHRSQEMNKDECVDRLRTLLAAAKKVPRKRRPTKPTRGAKERRLSAKKHRGEIKRARREEE